MPRYTHPFSVEDDETIHKMAEAKYSMRECALVLKRTRNSIAGRAFRLGIPFGCKRQGKPAQQPSKEMPVFHAVGYRQPSLPKVTWGKAA